MTTIISTRVISLVPTVTRQTINYVGVFIGVPKPPIPFPPGQFKKYFVPLTLTNIRLRTGIYFSLAVRPMVVFRV